MDTTSFGDRMKSYEFIETQQKFMPGLPVYVRLDGRSFSKFTKRYGMEKPFDKKLRQVFIDTTKALVSESRAAIGYTQSDEISLIIDYNTSENIIFDGKKQKLVSVLSSIATCAFIRSWQRHFPEKPLWYDDEDFEIYEQKVSPQFDCRCFQTPSRSEAVNEILWRDICKIKSKLLH